MAEAGGTSTQAGIFYQNSVAALALADLLELAPIPPRERVVEVRVEAPSDVDDVVIRYADGHREFQNIKSDITPGSEPWNALWKSLCAQFSQPDFGADDQLMIVLGELTPNARVLRDICERAVSAIDGEEWRSRLAVAHEKLLAGIETLVSPSISALELLRRTTVRVLSEDQIDGEFARRRLGGKFALPAKLLSTLRDIAGGGARTRALFLAAPLRRRLMLEHDIELSEPAEWGLAAYRAAIGRLARIEIPGTQVSGSAEELFVWPRTQFYECTRVSGFEDEDSLDRMTKEAGIVDMRAFPSDHLTRCVIVAGPGHGKSALLTSVAGRLIKGPHVPVHVPLASLAASDVGVIEFLATQVNREFEVKADWQRLAEQGLLVMLFDGLDEIPSAVRPVLLGRIATFSARYPAAPWLLTVRDPSVLAGPSEAQIVELLPLNDEDIVRFVETMKRRLSSVDVYEFVRRLTTYPDLNRLARIPLFLSILLATIDDVRTNLPATRSDLIEAYLKTLFEPHAHKVVTGTHDHTVPLRDIAEALAFERLERQEIGASEREVREVIFRTVQSTAAVESLFERLRANGILRQQSAIRLQFPFPIVQEYLAACHLVRHSPESLSSRIDDAIQRPWAQVIQFALEQHPDPTPAIRAMLGRPDDAFCTGLRLVGRCVANGAQVDASIHNEVGDRLVRFWIGASLAARGRVGRLIVDSFSRPMSPALRSAVHHQWLMHDGAGEIISNAKDRDLTMSVLKGLLDSELGTFVLYHSLKPAISAIGDEAFTAILERFNGTEEGTSQREGIASLIEHFLPGSVSTELALAVTSDARIPRKVRLRALYAAGAPLDGRSLQLIREAFALENDNELWPAFRLLENHPGRSQEFRSALRDERLGLERRKKLAGYFTQIFPDEKARSEFIKQSLSDSDLDPSLVDIIRLYAARFGDRSVFEILVEQIAQVPIEMAVQTISLFGHYPDRELAERAADLAEPRVITSKDAVQVGHAATTGMLYIFDMDFGFSGLLRHTAPHAATGRWMQLVEEWSERVDLSVVQRLELLTSASQLGSVRAHGRLQAEVLSMTDPDAAVFDQDDSYGNVISNAIREARRRGPLLPLPLAERLVRAKRPNLPQQGIGAIEAHSTRAALLLLIKLHGEAVDWFVKSTLEDSIESLAAKLSEAVKREAGALNIS